MLIGEFIHTLDPKKRLALPSKFRSELGKKVVITQGLDNCLFIYPLKEWQKVNEKIVALPMGQSDARGFGRFMFAGAVETNVDGIGRILIPDFLKEFAGLTAQVAIVGISTRIELWDEGIWKEYKARIQKQADKLAEKLGEIGAI